MPDCWGKILFCPLLSEYQVRRIRRPTFLGVVGGEVVWNEGLNFGTEGEELDRFSTFDGMALRGPIWSANRAERDHLGLDKGRYRD